MKTLSHLWDIMVAIIKAAFAGVLLNSIIYLISLSTDLISSTLPVSPDGQPISILPVILASILPVIGAGFVYWVISLLTRRAYLYFAMISVVILIASFAMPFSVPDMPVSMALILNVMHVVVAGSVLLYFSNLKSKKPKEHD